jgi:hypothetical protein
MKNKKTGLKPIPASGPPVLRSERLPTVTRFQGEFLPEME